MRITFLGASRTVTGSSYLLEAGGRKFLVDCGMFQGSKTTEALNWRPFAYDPTSLDCVLLTHAHIDHTGMVPRLCKSGFKGKIYATRATASLCRIMLPDSAHIQEFEAEINNRKGRRAGKGLIEPLYTVDDAYKSLEQFAPMPYGEKLEILPGVTVRFNDAGHILGSSIIEIWAEEGDKTEKLVFSGDLGQPDQPLIKDPTYIDEADYIIMESTYGNRKHEHFNRQDLLAEIINDTVQRGGNVVIPAFAVGRTQTIVYYLHQLLKAGKIPDLPIYIDSPLAISATDIFIQSPEDYDAEAREMVKRADNPLKLPQLIFTRTAEESKRINQREGSAIILSASGMADAGRILHHLKHNLWRPESSILLVGYQSPGSLGRRLTEGIKRVKIMGEDISVKAKIYNLDGFSAHADQDQLVNWLAHLQKPPANIFLVHGEAEMSEAFAVIIKEKFGFPAYIPRLGDAAALEGREFRIEPSSLVFVDPAVQKLQDIWDLIEADFAEFKKRIEQVLATGNGQIAIAARALEKLRKVLRDTMEAIGSGGGK